jgi:hypothetical protein
MPRKAIPLAARFWPHVQVTTWGECWPWTGKWNRRTGYGMAWMGQRPSGTGVHTHAHRVAFFLAYGHWPVVCRHSCDRPLCCNPLHLQDGTHTDNFWDMWERGRYWRHRKA